MYWTLVFSQGRANNILWSQEVMDVDASKKHAVLLNILAFFVAYCDFTATKLPKVIGKY